MQIQPQFKFCDSARGARLPCGLALRFIQKIFSVSLKLLAIRLSSQETAAKSLVMW